MNMVHRWKDTEKSQNPSAGRKTYPSANFPQKIELGLAYDSVRVSAVRLNKLTADGRNNLHS
jgi:hypothetical protein